MTENHGAHGDAGATDNEDLNTQETAATNESAAASMDAQLESRARTPPGTGGLHGGSSPSSP